jgi:AbrB family looped-hinge helix DNA binding protein
MQTRVSTKGQVVLPGPIRRRLGLQTGDTLDIHIQAGALVLTPRKKAKPKVQVVYDRLTGYSSLSAGADAPVLTSKEVAEMLANFP